MLFFLNILTVLFASILEKTTVETPLMVTEVSDVDLVTLLWDLYQTQYEILKLPAQRGL